MAVNNKAVTTKAASVWRWSAFALCLVVGGWATWWWQAGTVALKLAVWLAALPLLALLVYPTPEVVSVRQYVQALVSEVAKVVWPRKDDVIRLTVMVGVIVALFGVVLWCLDAFFVWALGLSGS